MAHRPPRQRQRMGVILGQIIGHARQAGMHIAAAQILGADHLAGGGLHQGRPSQKIVPCSFTMIVTSLIAGT